MPEGKIQTINGDMAVIDDGTEINKLFRSADLVEAVFSDLQIGMRVTFIPGRLDRLATEVRIVEQDSTDLERKYDNRRFI